MSENQASATVGGIIGAPVQRRPCGKPQGPAVFAAARWMTAGVACVNSSSGAINHCN